MNRYRLRVFRGVLSLPHETQRNTGARLPLTLLVLSMFLILPLSADAASFDCRKAKIEPEKLVCGDEALSKLDERLAQLYGKALGRAKEKAALRRDQQRWLREVRDACSDADCLRQAYEGRIAVLHASDHDKAGRFREVLQKYPVHRWVWRDSSEMPMCEAMLRELRSGASAVEFIEPILRAATPEDPRLREFKRCEDFHKVPYLPGPGEPEPFEYLSLVGHRNFQIYQLGGEIRSQELDRRTVYAERVNLDTGALRRGGYFDIDLNRCVVVRKGEIPLGSGLEANESAIVRFRGAHYVLGLQQAGRGSKYRVLGFTLSVWNWLAEGGAPVACHWVLDLPDKQELIRETDRERQSESGR